MVDLNSLIPSDRAYCFSACSINSRGEIIGLAFDTQGNFHGYLATPTDGAVESSNASSVASGGRVSSTREGPSRPPWSVPRWATMNQQRPHC